MGYTRKADFYEKLSLADIKSLEDAKSVIRYLADKIELLGEKANSEFVELQRATVAAGVTTIVVSGGGAGGGIVTIGGYGAKSVNLTAGTHVVGFGQTFSSPFIYGVLSCIGIVQGEKVVVGNRIINVTNSDMTVVVDADCVLQHFEILTT